MHPLEHRLIAQDPDLPSLALLHDDDALSAALRAHDPTIHRARVHYLRYKPHTHCLAALHLEHHDGKQSHAYAKALPRASHDWDWQQRRLHKRDGGIRLALAAHHLLIASPNTTAASPPTCRRKPPSCATNPNAASSPAWARTSCATTPPPTTPPSCAPPPPVPPSAARPSTAPTPTTPASPPPGWKARPCTMPMPRPPPISAPV